jgi:DNA-binding transcriptional regulator YiaG
VGIAQCTNRIKFAPDTRFKRFQKPLPASIKTLSDWIRNQRTEKNLTCGHLAEKMGIAAAMVRSWEDGISQPGERQMDFLKKYFESAPLKRLFNYLKRQ